jgi:hypothetical protein
MSEINSRTISNTLNTIDRNYENEQKKTNTKYILSNGFNKFRIKKSWDFTPFPKFLFPQEKKYFLNDFNKLNFPGVNENSLYNKDDKEQKFKIFIEEIKGDITKSRAPAYTFGSPRNEVKVPFHDFHELISPSPGSYNLRPLEGFNSSSPKYSFPKKRTNKFKYIKNEISPGPGHYQINKCDLSNQGNYQLSTYTNPPASNFGLYKEQRDKDIAFRSRNNINVGPGSYDVNNRLTMFSGNGKYTLSNFSNNNAKTISNQKLLYRYPKYGISPGPGSYNHHSIFIGGRYSK